MAQSSVEICNRALLILGQAGVLSTGQEDQHARACDLYYNPSVRMLLERGNWTFATRRAKLNRLAEEPAYFFKYAYQLPVEFLRIQEVAFGESGELPVTNDRFYSVESSMLLCDQDDNVFIKYTALITDPKIFSELFAEAVAMSIAVRVAYTLVETSAAQQQLLLGWEANAIQEAKSFDSMNQALPTGFPSPVVACKY